MDLRTEEDMKRVVIEAPDTIAKKGGIYGISLPDEDGDCPGGRIVRLGDQIVITDYDGDKELWIEGILHSYMPCADTFQGRMKGFILFTRNPHGVDLQPSAWIKESRVDEVYYLLSDWSPD